MNIDVLNKIKEIAVKVSGQSPLCVGREKIDTKQICSYPELTIIDFDFISYDDKTTGEHIEYPVIIFKEIDDGFYCGGMALNDLCHALAENEVFMSEIRESGLKLEFEATRTKTGNTYVNFTVL